MKQEGAWPTLASPACSAMSVDGIECARRLIGEFYQTGGETLR
jgi:hypothetical protein